MAEWYDIFKNIVQLAGKIFENSSLNHNDLSDFDVQFNEEGEPNQQKGVFGAPNLSKRVKVLSFWCFNAGVGFKEI